MVGKDGLDARNLGQRTSTDVTIIEAEDSLLVESRKTKYSTLSPNKPKQEMSFHKDTDNDSDDETVIYSNKISIVILFWKYQIVLLLTLMLLMKN